MRVCGPLSMGVCGPLSVQVREPVLMRMRGLFFVHGVVGSLFMS